MAPFLHLPGMRAGKDTILSMCILLNLNPLTLNPMKTKSAHTLRTYAFFTIFCIVPCLITCKGPDGETGPAGPAGPAGPQGIQGVAGPAGNTGMVVSAWTLVPDSTWIAAQDRMYFTVSREDSKITQPILDKGLAIAYYRNSGRDNVVFSLPSASEGLNLGYFMAVRDGKGSITFDMLFDKPHTQDIDFDLEFRWIILPSTTGGRLSNLDWSNYDLVKKELQLAD
jgi:hypothetical protein